MPLIAPDEIKQQQNPLRKRKKRSRRERKALPAIGTRKRKLLEEYPPIRILETIARVPVRRTESKITGQVLRTRIPSPQMTMIGAPVSQEHGATARKRRIGSPREKRRKKGLRGGVKTTTQPPPQNILVAKRRRKTLRRRRKTSQTL